MNTLESLKAARAIIAVNFAQGKLVRKGYGGAPSCYCSIGALGKVAGRSDDELEFLTQSSYYAINPEAITALAQQAPDPVDNRRSGSVDAVWETNDRRGKSAALAMFDKAIAKLENAQ